MNALRPRFDKWRAGTAVAITGLVAVGFSPPRVVHAEPPGPESPELGAAVRAGKLGFTRIVAVERHRLDPSHVYTYHAEGLRPGGGLITFSLVPGEGAPRRLVDAGEGIILDCAVSYDGERALFSWKRSMNTPFQIYEVGLDGAGLRQITHPPSNNMNPCWLPDGGIAFLSDRKPAYAYCWVTTSPVLYRCDGDGGSVIRLSANYLNDFTPSILRDGRILYSRWEYVDRPAIPIQSLWTVHPDGTGLAGFFGNRVLSPATFMEARQIPGSHRVLCVLTSHNGPCRGAIGIIDTGGTVNGQDGITNLTPEIGIGQVNAGDGNSVRGPYESPYPVDDTHFLVSRDGTILLRDYDGGEQTTLLNRGASLGYYSAQPIRPSEPPSLRPSLLPVAPEDSRATLLLQDVYHGLEPHVRRGEIARIAVVQEMEKSQFADKKYRAFGFQFPVVSCGATYAPKQVWGYATVESDGSAHFRVPSGVPIYFLALDQAGRALQRMRTFTHLMPGERQSCIGCHADRNHAAPRGQSPPLAGLRPAQSLSPPEWGIRGFSYAHIVQPVWDHRCVECHNALRKEGGVDLAGDRTDLFCVSYETLARSGTGAVDPSVGGYRPEAFGANPYTSWIATYNGMEANILEITPKQWGSPASRLAELIQAGHPDAEGRPRISLTAAEKRRAFAWIDLNVPYYGTSESNHYEAGGCRQLLPSGLEEVLADVAARRCVKCHDGGRVPRGFYTRITNVEHNGFLLAPLAIDAGGAGTCGQEVFRTTEDPDYRAILKTFEPLKETIRDRPRKDML